MYYQAKSAIVEGSVRIGEEVNIWHGAVVRGDITSIDIGDRTNIQDLVCVHVSHGAPVRIGTDCVIGHGSILHGCVISDHVLVGMGSIVMDHSVIGEGSIIGAGTLILENTIIPPGSVVVGSPGRVIRTGGEAQKEQILQTAARYVDYAQESLERVEVG